MRDSTEVKIKEYLARRCRELHAEATEALRDKPNCEITLDAYEFTESVSVEEVGAGIERVLIILWTKGFLGASSSYPAGFRRTAKGEIQPLAEEDLWY